MNPIPQQLLICGTVLFLLSLLIGFAIPVFANPRMGVEMHVTGLQSGMALWALGLMWQRVALSAGARSGLRRSWLWRACMRFLSACCLPRYGEPAAPRPSQAPAIRRALCVKPWLPCC